MKCFNLKVHTNGLGATALAGTLGISILSLTAIQPVMAQSLYLSGGGGGGGSLTGNGGYGAGALISAEKPNIRGHGAKVPAKMEALVVLVVLVPPIRIQAKTR